MGAMRSNGTMAYQAINSAAAAQHLQILGGFHPDPGDGAPPGCETLVMLGPGPDFWAHLTASAEYHDGAPDPIDRWSRRVLTALAADHDATALFPFGGPPYAPFYSWALSTGRAWAAPIAFLVHDTEGLFVSYRGALALSRRIPLPEARAAAPCHGCDAPCLSGCPVDALGPERYDVPACAAFLETGPGRGCREDGCAARRACPVGQGRRSPAQSAYHMDVFLRNFQKSADPKA